METLNENLKNLVNKSVFILREARSQFKNLGALWSTGKDSTVGAIALARAAFFGEIPYPVIHMDTGYKFPEIYKFRQEMADKFGFELIVVKDDLAGKFDPKAGRLDCCTRLKTEVLKRTIHEYGFDGIIVSIRRDEHGIRNLERYMSPRDREFRWRLVEEKKQEDEGDSPFVALQDTEMSGWNLYPTDFGDEADHVRVHPILHWTEEDVWLYIKAMNLPFNSLYVSRGGWRYRSLGCWPCTEPIKSNATTIDEFIQEIRLDREGERSGRSQDKEETYAMQKLRVLGYM